MALPFCFNIDIACNKYMVPSIIIYLSGVFVYALQSFESEQIVQ